MNLSDRVTARAVHLTLSSVEREMVVAELVALAGERPIALEIALARLHRGVARRHSDIGVRAAASVEAALAVAVLAAA